MRDNLCKLYFKSFAYLLLLAILILHKHKCSACKLIYFIAELWKYLLACKLILSLMGRHSFNSSIILKSAIVKSNFIFDNLMLIEQLNTALEVCILDLTGCN